jgi:hypothetical protein
MCTVQFFCPAGVSGGGDRCGVVLVVMEKSCKIGKQKILENIHPAVLPHVSLFCTGELEV